MRLKFTKMHGAGNDFVVLDATRAPLSLDREQFKAIADRRFGVGADQILVVGTTDSPDVDFSYRIFNNDGGEVEQCGNGARAFVRFVREKGLSDKSAIKVSTLSGVIEPRIEANGLITVDMGAPIFDPVRVPFDPSGLVPRKEGAESLWPLTLEHASGDVWEEETVWVSVLSMGNPHAVQIVDDLDAAPVAEDGRLIEHHVRFPKRVNAGFVQIVQSSEIRLRVFERGAGETLSCGTGACAAVVAGIRRGVLASEPGAPVTVHTRGGDLIIAWGGMRNGVAQPVMMTGPAVTVFEGEIEI
jgi:diaminopimelate epimerase